MTGETISHYRVLREIGSGGMGVVYDDKLSREIRNRKKLGSNLGQISAENKVKPYYKTQNQAKRFKLHHHGYYHERRKHSPFLCRGHFHRVAIG
jgi:hypothetical protein